jgi:hypothetical protein
MAMKHRPTRLALMISLIGAGIAPCAHARSDLRVLGSPEVTLASALDDIAATLLEARDPGPDFPWASDRAPAALSGLPGAPALYSAGFDEGAPGESPAAAELVDARASTRTQAPTQTVVADPDDAPQPTTHADRLLEDLSAFVREAPVAAAVPEQISSAPAAVPTEAMPDRQEASMPRFEPENIVVAPESSKVLRSLEAILSDERDEVGAIRLDPRETIVSTESDKVMAMLAAVSAAQQEPVEDGAAKRARKRAALAAKAAAEAQAEAQPRVSPFGDQRTAVSEDSLDHVRGGFGSDGLNISFGIERAVYINGSLVTTTSLNVSSLGQVVAGRGATTFDAGTIALIQSGLGNSVSTGSISSSSMGTVIQNTLDGQKIQNITVINATANSLGLMRGMNLGASLRGAVIDSLRR